MKYIGIDWRGATNPLPIQPEDFVLFCDLRGCILDEFNLSKVEFLGCSFNGASFQRATLKETKFIGCFSSDRGLPTDFRNCLWQDVFVIDSHLDCVFDSAKPNLPRWDVCVEEAAWDTLATRSDYIDKGLEKLKHLGTPVVVPLVARLLANDDWDWWDVRSVALKALGYIRQIQAETKLKFPYRDEVLLEWMFLCLGDEHSIVRQVARQLVKELMPTDQILLTSTRRIMGQTSKEKLAGLRACLELCYYIDDIRYSRLVNVKVVETL